ncbi:PHP domain-containing protein [Methanotrichaceae archaeon M04Ac]|uniref:PHP domain-containing protein n=1 Tax=Candidatus Methanocrinis alkalitolerans TaxID=3033395 RepID=A0ABT5XGG2_9EURY|nr:PHP domain-containing protein [Candidatus Methanocrinis alkalitolerans]MCR3883681.1 PHP domain-containing protein [Methanothrix sp.]MDF0593810.1 PHP domain-containing protein [Candidatus Methanocrinis alkalitolerans]
MGDGKGKSRTKEGDQPSNRRSGGARSRKGSSTPLRLDLHVHSSFSDGRDGVEEILKAALEGGLDGIAITDHDTLEGYFEAERIVREEGLDLLVIPGVEVSTSEGHLLALGVRKLPPSGRSADETIEFIRVRGGIAIVSHPYHLFRHSMYRIPDCDAVEVYNSKYVFGIANFWAKRMAERRGLPMVAGSDAHMARTVGLGVTVVDVEEGSDLGDVLESIRGGRVKIDSKRMSPSVFVSQMVRWTKKRLRRRLKR